MFRPRTTSKRRALIATLLNVTKQEDGWGWECPTVPLDLTTTKENTTLGPTIVSSSASLSESQAKQHYDTDNIVDHGLSSLPLSNSDPNQNSSSLSYAALALPPPSTPSSSITNNLGFSYLANFSIYRINNILNQAHEPILPVGHSDYGGITGKTMPASVINLFCSLIFEIPEPYQLGEESIFVDLGSGMGLLCFAAGSLNIHASIGVELSSLVVKASIEVLKKIHSSSQNCDADGPLLKSSVYFVHENLMSIFFFLRFRHQVPFIRVKKPSLGWKRGGKKGGGEGR